ncbi:helix-turn-helix domain-containing protein [Nocardia sp. BSTN01]|uniref:helix-turn-helix domain-containing protein n=1 Tax=Nocardia sp. BSTN01 TaxID=2783665 RepID=UPI00188DF038|nr:helix-turn-helix domain-containing protein [Nocardia sp. BSTN01]MBF5002524.1 helix-turn-helix domain-containing protein [Nocardia sp. BSTN01]
MTAAAELPDLRLYTVPEVAEILHVTEVWVIRQLRARKLPGRKVSRQWFLTRGDIEAAIESMARPAIAPKPDPAGLSRGSRRALNRRMAR